MVSFPEHGFVVLLATSAGVAAGVADGDVTGVLHGVPVSAGAALLTAVSVGTGVAEATALLVDVELAEVDVGAAHRETCSALTESGIPVYSATNSSRDFRAADSRRTTDSPAAGGLPRVADVEVAAMVGAAVGASAATVVVRGGALVLGTAVEVTCIVAVGGAVDPFSAVVGC